MQKHTHKHQNKVQRRSFFTVHQHLGYCWFLPLHRVIHLSHVMSLIIERQPHFSAMHRLCRNEIVLAAEHYDGLLSQKEPEVPEVDGRRHILVLLEHTDVESRQKLVQKFLSPLFRFFSFLKNVFQNFIYYSLTSNKHWAFVSRNIEIYLKVYLFENNSDK